MPDVASGPEWRTGMTWYRESQLRTPDRREPWRRVWTRVEGTEEVLHDGAPVLCHRIATRTHPLAKPGLLWARVDDGATLCWRNADGDSGRHSRAQPSRPWPMEAGSRCAWDHLLLTTDEEDGGAVEIPLRGTLAVVGTETVDVRAGRFDCWVLEGERWDALRDRTDLLRVWWSPDVRGAVLSIETDDDGVEEWDELVALDLHGSPTGPLLEPDVDLGLPRRPRASPPPARRPAPAQGQSRWRWLRDLLPRDERR